MVRIWQFDDNTQQVNQTKNEGNGNNSNQTNVNVNIQMVNPKVVEKNEDSFQQ